MCGGTVGSRWCSARFRGLSPRVRGNHQRDRARARGRGSIPACAGEPLLRRCSASAARVYPRVCGGTVPLAGRHVRHTGLSPRVRGNRRRRGQHPHRPGSIPACAGEPTPCPSTPPWRWVYPRVCGGTWPSAEPAKKSVGLSPRVRGNRARDPQARRGRGSIPACAGEPLGVNTLFYLTS